MVSMTNVQIDQSTPQKPLRLWPGVAASVLQLVFRFGVPVVAPEAMMVGIAGMLLCTLAIFVWWLFFSRVSRLERWGAVALMIAAVAATPLILHESIVNGMMGMMFYVYVVPILSLALVAWAVISRGLAQGARRAALVAAIVLSCAVFALLRTDGILGGGGAQFAWRWTPTAEERLLAEAGDEPITPAVAPSAKDGDEPGTSAPQPAADAQSAIEAQAGGDAETDAGGTSADAAGSNAPEEIMPLVEGKIAAEDAPGKPSDSGDELLPTSAAQDTAEWPGFRGPNRDGRASGVRIETNWTQSPPVEMWRRPVGPGWSSFAVQGELLYTQEQRGDDEVVSCYILTTGEPVWLHRDATRFWESNAGAGPRGTPSLGGGRVYSFGATGILNALDAWTGGVIWSRNAATDTGTKVPYWGFSSSPLVAGELVIVATAGQLAAYDRATGAPRWTGPAHGDSYSSPQRLTIGGVPQIVLLSRAGATSLAPSDGALLWEHSWEGFTSLQPALAANGDLLFTTSGDTAGLGVRRLAVSQSPSGWTAEERWTSTGLKPYFNDFVVHKGHAYGFDGRILSAIDLENGERKWKGGRYGNGQLILLPDQDVLLVLSDTGELALVAATPAEFQELAKFPALEGKTWNHPALAGEILLVRNDREMAAFRLTPVNR